MALNYHEPYASSASELVTELMQYLVEPSDVLKCEAEALLAGIVLDLSLIHILPVCGHVCAAVAAGGI